MTTLPRKTIGLATGRNGDWEITGIRIWGSNSVFFDALGKRGTVIERAGIVINDRVVAIEEMKKYLESAGYKVTRG
jgi:hypothetical protein